MKSICESVQKPQIPVAPFAGAWIEIRKSGSTSFLTPSLPSRERGLKFEVPQLVVGRDLIAPFAGAWIEITLLLNSCCSFPVAPFAGAWIEIRVLLLGQLSGGSLPSRERGLKCLVMRSKTYLDRSLPSRERGLKFRVGYIDLADELSLPSRERGLKSANVTSNDGWSTVAPFTGAWIEIVIFDRNRTLSESLPSRERGLKSPLALITPDAILSLPSRERGLKSPVETSSAQPVSRSLHGSVD